MDNGTFEPVELPSGRKAIGCRWVFKLKRKADGAVDKYKARLVAKGFSQRPGLDFGQVFAPTARWAALRAIFALVALEDLDMYSVDVSNAFLNGELDHEVYMQQPEGFESRFGHGTVVEVYALPPLLYYFSSFLLFYPCSILLFRFYTFISCAMQHLLLLFHSQHLHKLLFCLVRVFASFLACFSRY